MKDRAALAMIVEAERAGALKAGGTVVEASAGNTGVGLAVVCAVRGYRCVVVLPESTSREKQAVLRALASTATEIASGAFDAPTNVEEFLEHKNTLDPSARAVGDIASVHLIGGVIGALVFGRLSNKFGQARAAQPVRGDPRDLAERADDR